MPPRRKTEAKAPEIPEVPKTAITITLQPDEIPALREILDIATAGIPSTRVTVLASKLRKAIE